MRSWPRWRLAKEVSIDAFPSRVRILIGYLMILIYEVVGISKFYVSIYLELTVSPTCI